MRRVLWIALLASFSLFAALPGRAGAQTITVTSPAGGETFYSGSICPIEWTATGEYLLDARVELIKEGAPVRTIASDVRVAEGNLDWRICESIPAGDGYRIRITSLLDAGVVGMSGEFSISGGGVTVIEPSAGATWYRGLEYAVKWTFDGHPGEAVRIDLFKGESFCACLKDRIRMEGRRSGAFKWLIPPLTPSGTDYRIRVTVLGKIEVSGDSGNFTISPGTISVSAPAAGDVLYKEQEYPVKWSFTGHGGRECVVELVRLDFHRVLKARMRLDARGFKWLVPADVPSGDGYRIRVKDYAGIVGQSGEFVIDDVRELGGRMRVASFHIKGFSNANRSDDMLLSLADVLKRYDLIAIQGILDPDAEHLMQRTVAALRTRTEGAEYLYDLGPTTGGERFAFVHRPGVAHVTYARSHTGGTFVRQPYYCTFKKGEFDFTVVTCRLEEGTANETQRAIREAEVRSLETLFTQMQAGNGEEQDVILLGEFHTNPGDPAFENLRSIPTMRHLIAQPTMITGTAVFDNIWFENGNLGEFTGRSGVFPFDEIMYGGDKHRAKVEISEHRPVWAEFSVLGPDDD